MLLTGLAAGCPLDLLDPAGRAAAAEAVGDGLAAPEAHAAGRVVLTRRGRLLAHAVIPGLTGRPADRQIRWPAGPPGRRLGESPGHRPGGTVPARPIPAA